MATSPYTYNSSGNLIPTPGAAPGTPGSSDTSVTTTPSTTSTPTYSATTPNSNPLPDPSQTGSQPIQAAPPPTNPMAPDPNAASTGQQGQNVQALQQWLVSSGYLSAQQMATGPGTYGPNTTAAVAALQKSLGLNPTGQYDQNTANTLSQKYNAVHKSLQGTQTQDNQAQAQKQVDTATAAQSSTSTDPIFGALSAQMAPIMNALTQTVQNLNNPVVTGATAQDYYNQMAANAGLPQMQTELLQWQNAMNWTEDDIRDQVTQAGGGANESQILAMTAARNKTILKQYSAVSANYNAAQSNIQAQMQYYTSDQQVALQKQTMTISALGTLEGAYQSMAQMGLTMQQNAKQAVQYNVTQTGYSGLAASAQGNPQVLGYYENLLNLAPGTLSNPDSLAALDTYKQQQLVIAEQNAKNAGARTYIYGVSQGVTPPGGGSGGSSGTTFGNGTTSSFTIPSNALTRPSWLNANVPLSMSAQDAQNYQNQYPGKVTIGGSAGSSQYGNNFDVTGVGHYIAQPDGSYILGSALPQELSNPDGVQGLMSSLSASNPPTLNYSDIAAIIQNAPGSKYGPATTAFYREQRSARQLLGNFTQSPVYETVSQAPLPFARIQAARNGDNSVSDTELLDSYITLAKGSGQITEAQIAAITQASSVSDKLNIIKQKVAGAGALISADQRKSLLSLSGSVFDQYSAQYKNLYTQAINVLAKNHMEPAVWGVIPDFTTMITTGDTFAQQNQ